MKEPKIEDPLLNDKKKMDTKENNIEYNYKNVRIILENSIQANRKLAGNYEQADDK